MRKMKNLGEKLCKLEISPIAPLKRKRTCKSIKVTKKNIKYSEACKHNRRKYNYITNHNFSVSYCQSIEEQGSNFPYFVQKSTYV